MKDSGANLGAPRQGGGSRLLTTYSLSWRRKEPHREGAQPPGQELRPFSEKLIAVSTVFTPEKVIALHRQKRETLIKEILANKRNKFSREKLEKQPAPHELLKLENFACL